MVAPTCTEVGYTLHECECGHNYQDLETGCVGHEIVAGVDPVTKMPCFSCSRCDFSYTLKHTQTYSLRGRSQRILESTAVEEYSYTEEDLGAVLDTINYTYGNSAWGDLLTAYDGSAITHDEIGNPLDDGTWTYTWEHGRQLASMTAKDGTGTWNFTYNADGLRTSRTNGTTTYKYQYLSGQLVKMTVDDKEMYFNYDASGTPVSMVYNGTTYYYVMNLQGDIVGIVNQSGNQLVGYTYDAWGNILTTTGSSANTLGKYNPLRYRGYVYDSEIGMFYLQSRYYDPEVGRFINADAFASTGCGLLGNNMIAYCNNNPVNLGDTSGVAPWPTTVAISDCRAIPFGFAYEMELFWNMQKKEQERRDMLVPILTAIATPSSDGGTFSAGIVMSQNMSGSGPGWSGVISADTGNNYAIQTSQMYSTSTGLGASAGLVVTWTNAKYVSDLDGESVSYGATIVSGWGFSVDYLTFSPASDPDSKKWGISIAILAGAGADGHMVISNASTQASWSPLQELIRWLNGG